MTLHLRVRVHVGDIMGAGQFKLDNIDKVLLKGIKHLNWKSHAISEFIQQSMSLVCAQISFVLPVHTSF